MIGRPIPSILYQMFDASLETEEVIDRSIGCHVTVSKKRK
jgi:hypothetical protein